ncbi:MAG: hypothetical protein ACFFB5_18185 [Promethearchaeota archaeon]
MKLLKKILFFCFLFLLLSLNGLRSESRPDSLVPIIYVPKSVIEVDANKPFTLTYILIDDNPNYYVLKRDGEEVESGRIRSSVLNFTRSPEPPGEVIIFTLEITDYSNNVVSQDITVVIRSPSPTQDTDFVGHCFSEHCFAVEVDLAVPENTEPNLIRDLLYENALTNDSNKLKDDQFYTVFINDSGIDTFYTALEKVENNLTFGSLLDENDYNVFYATPAFHEALNTSIFRINASTPFQQLIQHYITPWDEDVFVTNNFMSLMAYSSNLTDREMDENDSLYLGYTITTQELIDAVNELLRLNNQTYQITPFNYKPSFEETTNGFNFGINYTNMFVLWQEVNLPVKGVDVFGNDQHIKDDTRGVIFGQDIYAATVLDFVSFNYVFETIEISGKFSYIKGRLTAHYDIGETSFLLITEDSIPSGAWNHTPFAAVPSYTLEVPNDLVGTPSPGGGTIQNNVTIYLPESTFYMEDDARERIQMDNGFGLTVTTTTTTFGIDVVNPEYNTQPDEINLYMGGYTYFTCEFHNQKGVNPSLITVFTPFDWPISNVAKEYFKVEFDLVYDITKFVINKISSELNTMPESASLYIGTILYFTFTDFPKWYGCGIINNFTYYTIAAMTAPSSSTTSTSMTSEPPPTSSHTGFEIFYPILGLLFLKRIYTLKKSNKGNQK